MSHDSVVNSHAGSSSSNIITKEASRVAIEAVNALRKSRKRSLSSMKLGHLLGQVGLVKQVKLEREIR